MHVSFTFSRFRMHLYQLLAVFVCLFTACSKQAPQQIDFHSAEPARLEKLRNENQKLQQALKEREASLHKRDIVSRALEDKIATLELQLMEKEEQIKQLKERQMSDQKMLDEAILEVVRAKAKLRSLESKAEAASDIAEAEIAVKALKAHLVGREPVPELIKAEQLLKMSVREFKKENYGGASYLTTQAKSHIKMGQMLVEGRDGIEPIAGEVMFSQPVPLRVLKRSNLRQGPGRKYKIVTTLKKGSSLIGYSYKGQWLRVNREAGNYGWIHQALVGGR